MKINTDLNNNDSTIEKISENIIKLVKNGTQLEQELKEVWKECPNCPLCGGKKE
jgi:hypothetical protein